MPYTAFDDRIRKLRTIQFLRTGELLDDGATYTHGRCRDPRGRQDIEDRKTYKEKKTSDNKENHLIPWPMLETHDIDCHILKNLLTQRDTKSEIKEIIQRINDRKVLSEKLGYAIP